MFSLGIKVAPDIPELDYINQQLRRRDTHPNFEGVEVVRARKSWFPAATLELFDKKWATYCCKLREEGACSTLQLNSRDLISSFKRREEKGVEKVEEKKKRRREKKDLF